MAESEIIAALKDACMPQDEIENVMTAFRTGQRLKAKRLLADYRAAQLGKVHEEQERLFNLDYLLRELKQSKEI